MERFPREEPRVRHIEKLTLMTIFPDVLTHLASRFHEERCVNISQEAAAREWGELNYPDVQHIVVSIVVGVPVEAAFYVFDDKKRYVRSVAWGLNRR